MNSDKNLKLFKLFIFLILQLFLAIDINCQEISSELDSIYNHSINDESNIKIDKYYNILDKYSSNGNLVQLGNDAHQIGRWFFKDKQYELAVDFVKIAYKAREKTKPYDPELLSRSYFNYALYNKWLGKYDIAIEFFEKVVSINESEKLKGRAYALSAECYDIIGDSYKAIKDYKKAFFYYNKEGVIKNVLGGHINIGVAYLNIRSDFASKEAIYHFSETLKLRPDFVAARESLESALLQSKKIE